MTVHRWNAESEGPVDEQRLRHRLERLGYQLTRHEFPPGTRLPPREHDGDTADAVLAGRLRVTLGSTSVVLWAGEWAEVPAGKLRAAEVVGDEPVTCFTGVRA